MRCGQGNAPGFSSDACAPVCRQRNAVDVQNRVDGCAPAVSPSFSDRKNPWSKKHWRWLPAFYEHPLAGGKTKVQALVATIRKLLHAITACSSMTDSSTAARSTLWSTSRPLRRSHESNSSLYKQERNSRYRLIQRPTAPARCKLAQRGVWGSGGSEDSGILPQPRLSPENT